MNEEKLKNLQAKDIYNLSYDEIDAIQNKIDAENLEEIELAYRQHRINSEERDYLLEFFHDAMSVEREVHRSLVDSFRSPKRTCAFDPDTGKVDTDSKGNEINYGLKVVTPFTSTRIHYVDANSNALDVILPKMKTAKRAIEKLELEYGKDRKTECNKALDKFFENEDRDEFAERLQSVPKTTSQLHDILRLTITAKYLSNVQRLMRKLSENKSTSFYIVPEETRNRFDLPLSQNEKRYYDIKMIMHQRMPNGKVLDVEMQLKVDTLYMGDILTHGLYEKKRGLEAMLVKKGAQMEDFERRQTEAQIKILADRSRRINESFIHQYNMSVIDKAYRIEDNEYRPLRIKPENVDGTYNRCRDFIATEYLVNSYNQFDGKEEFAANSEQNKLCFLRMTGKLPMNFDAFSETASKSINYKFSRLTPAEIERFNGINEVARRYESVVRRKINEKHRADQPTPYVNMAVTNKIKAAKSK